MNVYLGELYKEVEYIQSSGTQYINTGVLPSNTKGIYAKLSSQDVSNDLVYLGAKPTSSTRCWVGNVHSTYDNRNGVYYGWESLLTEQVNRPTANTNSINEIGLNYLNSRNATFNGNIIHSNLASLTGGNYPIYIFCGNNVGTASYHSKIKLYSLKISDGSNLVRDFVPCYRVSDNVIGLFDKVENKFYTNAGTGTFTKGNDVKVFQPELKNDYIGEYTNEITEIYTITNIPNNNVNKYVSIYKSGYSIKKVILEGTASFSQGYGGTTGFYARLSSNTSGSIKYGPSFGYGSSSPYDINIAYNTGSGWVNTYTANNKVNATNTYKYEIDYNNWILTFNGELITQQLSSTEKTVVSNILNSTGACAYGARQDSYANDNPIKVTVIYEPK